MADADMSIGVEYALLGKNAVGSNEVLDQSGMHGAAGCGWRLCQSGRLFDPGKEYRGEDRDHTEASRTDHAILVDVQRTSLRQRSRDGSYRAISRQELASAGSRHCSNFDSC